MRCGPTHTQGSSGTTGRKATEQHGHGGKKEPKLGVAGAPMLHWNPSKGLHEKNPKNRAPGAGDVLLGHFFCVTLLTL